jgi:hypothetical protein
MPKLPLFVQPPAPTGPAKYISEDDPKKQTSFLDPITDFVRGLGYFPTEPIPQDASRPYAAGATLANVAPIVGPALKGLGMAASAVDLSGLPKSLDYVQNLLRESVPAARDAHPAVQALTSALEAPLAEPNLMQHVATSRVTGRLMPQRGFIDVPKGFDLAPGFKASPRVVPEEQAIWRQWTNAQKSMAGDPRLKMGSGLPELKQIEQSPVIRSVDELQNLPVSGGAVKEPPMLTQRVKRSPVVTNRKEGRISFKDLTPDHVRDIQKAAGAGMNQTQISKQFPQFSKDTITRALKMPWRD